MSQDLSGINKPRSTSGFATPVGQTTHTKAVGQGTGADANRHFQNPHDDKNWDNYTPTPAAITEAENPIAAAGDEPLLLSISALQAMLEDPNNSIFQNPNDQALWLSRLVALRGQGWANVPWHVGEPLPQLLNRLWAAAGL